MSELLEYVSQSLFFLSQQLELFIVIIIKVYRQLLFLFFNGECNPNLTLSANTQAALLVFYLYVCSMPIISGQR